MRKWIFITGFLICSLLFFLSGTMTGYLYCEKNLIKNATDEKSKDPRKPSTSSSSMSGKSILERMIYKQESNARIRTRMPTIPALQKAQRYKAQIIG